VDIDDIDAALHDILDRHMGRDDVTETELRAEIAQLFPAIRANLLDFIAGGMFSILNRKRAPTAG
jgi:hypothetical protein